METTKSFLSWFLQRISAAFLVIGLFVHFWVLHFALEKPLSFDKVQARLISPGWIIFDAILLLCVVYHGINGLWGIYLDFNPGEKARKIIGWFLFVIGVLSFFFGAYILFPFRGF